MLTEFDKIFLTGVIYREVKKAGGDMTKFGPLIAAATVASPAPGAWSAFVQMLINDLPQILSFITALIPLFAAF